MPQNVRSNENYIVSKVFPLFEKTHNIITYSSSFSLIGRRTHIISFIRAPSTNTLYWVPLAMFITFNMIYHCFPIPVHKCEISSHFSCPFCMNHTCRRHASEHSSTSSLRQHFFQNIWRNQFNNLSSTT